MPEDLKTLHDLRMDRASVPSHVIGFLKAYQRAARLHQFLAAADPNPPPEMTWSALAHLQVFTVCALETFFRDCFVTLCKRDPFFLKKSAEDTKGKIDYGFVEKLLSNSGAFEEKLAAQRSFQNLDCVNEAFSPFLEKPLFVLLEETRWSVFGVAKQSKPMDFTLSELWPDWLKLIYELFESRHQIIHNAHRPLPTNQEQVLMQSQIALLIGQLVGILIGNSLNVGHITLQVPLRLAMAYHLAMEFSQLKNPKDDFVAALESMNQDKELDDGFGYVGPFVFLGDDLMQTTFSDPSLSGDLVATHSCVVHRVRPQDTGGFVVDTLFGVTQ